MINLVRILTPSEYKEVWKWYTRDFEIRLSESSIFLYTQEDKLVTAAPFTISLNNFNLTEFQIQAVHTLTKKDFNQVKKDIKFRHKIKTQLSKLYEPPIENPKFYKRLLQVVNMRSLVKIQMSMQPNYNGFYYAEIKRRKTISFINTDCYQLCLDLFTYLEYYIGKDKELPYTLSQAWYEDFKVYGDRRFPSSVSRNNIEQAYYEYSFKEIMRVFRNPQKTSYRDAIDVFRILKKENKYYIMQTILMDKHFQINEDGFLIYYPVRQEALELETEINSL